MPSWRVWVKPRPTRRRKVVVEGVGDIMEGHGRRTLRRPHLLLGWFLATGRSCLNERRCLLFHTCDGFPAAPSGHGLGLVSCSWRQAIAFSVLAALAVNCTVAVKSTLPVLLLIGLVLVDLRLVHPFERIGVG